jgi:hypothetical protein
MLIKINNLIINTANILSAHFSPAINTRKESFRIVFVNHIEASKSTGTITLEDVEAVAVWDALCQEAKDASPA